MPPRFQLDPRAAQERPPPPPRPAAPEPPPPPVPEPPPRAPVRRAWVAWAAVAVAVLVVGGAVALYATGVIGPRYPDRYLLASDETPRGVALAEDWPELRERFGVASNPGRVDDDAMDDLTLPDGSRPDEAWVQSLDTPQSEGGLTVAALRFDDVEEANGYLRTVARVCGFGMRTTVMQDEEVVVLVTAHTSLDAGYKERVVAALREKADLRVVCSS